ncbi:TonB-dependent siderophore receptor [uncultured Kiloniella sp.]|uniref:TonB-dependent siderophore receptor n=1 Tax=uncultured Kiloniella sp. TaxID=1133091 RepID=UPI002613201B|nr:TonB-dependent siderophore receptor [uncultured Kiloniella sp.]
MSEVQEIRKTKVLRRYVMMMTTALATSLLTINSGFAQTTNHQTSNQKPLDEIAQNVSGEQQQNLRFQIAPQSLADSVLLFGQQANVQILADSAALENLRTSGVHGVMSLERGLIVLLNGTGLNYIISDDGTVTIGKFDPKGNQENSRLAPIVIEAESDDTLVQDGYVPLVSQIGTKKDTPLIEVPQNISVVTERQLDDRAPKTLNEALAYTPGIVTSAFGFDNRYDSFTIRGFDGVYNGVFRDGLRQFSGSSAVYRAEPYGVEGIEILKGPSSTLYGASSSGGFANIVTKRPTKDRLREVEFIAGNNERFQGNFDFSDAIDDDETIKYRLTGVVRDSETDLPGYNDNRTYIAPVIEWKPTEDTKLTVLTEYMDSQTGGTAFFYNDANGITDLYTGHEDWNDFDHEQYRLGYEFEHRFNDTFTFRQNTRYANVDINLEYAYRQGAGGSIQNAGLAVEEQETFVIDNHLITSVETGTVKHTLVTGFDYGTNEYEQRQGFGAIGGAITMNPSLAVDQEQDQIGIYMHDSLAWRQWRLNAGVRYDFLDAETKNNTGTIKQDEEEMSWQLGLSYVTDFGLVPFANYSTSFTPNVGNLVGGTPAAPTVGEQMEAGLKYEFLNQNAVIQASVFQIDQEDGIVFDSSSGLNVQVQQDMRSRGFELEAVASLTEGLSLNAAYAYTDVEIKDGPTGTVGKQVSGIPLHTLSTYVDYQFQNSSLRGLGVSGGVRYFGESEGNDTNTINNDARYFFDAALRYDLGEISNKLEGAEFKINANNLFDKDGQICASGSCYKDEGRTVQASLRYRF